MSDLFAQVDLALAINQQVVSHPNTDNVLRVKRLDLIHPEINGNKWFKLKYNIEQVLLSDHRTMLTFGGAWSNHIHAAASASRVFGFKSIGIIRGEEPQDWSPTLLYAKECGMQLEFISRLAYAEKDTEDFKGWLHEEYGSFHFVPEGGSNYLGVNGCMEILTEEDKKDFSYICCACGTGATLAGLLLSAKPGQKLIGFSALKDGSHLKEEVIKHLRYFLMNEELAREYASQFEIISDYSFGGYAKWNNELLEFMKTFETANGIPLDQVYTGKMLFGIIDMIAKGSFPLNAQILAIHSGGLQGRQSLSAS